MTEHTALPWTLLHDTNIVAGNRLVANVGGYQSNIHSSRPENEANARFIVTACNCHADLLRACKVAQRWLKRSGFGGNGALVVLDKAIRKAEETQ